MNTKRSSALAITQMVANGTLPKKRDMGTHVGITGNPVDGLFFYGPFTTSEEAIEWAERNHDGQDWWIAPLASKEE